MKPLLRTGLSLSAVLLMFSVLVPYQALGDFTYTRLGGTTQYDTAAEIARTAWDKADTAVIAVGAVGNSYDALAAGPLAAAKKAPLLLTEGDKLTTATQSVLQDLGTKQVYLIGGSGVIKPAVEKAIQAMGISVTRLAGYDAAETSVKIAQEMNNAPAELVLTGGKGQDALSVAPIAAVRGMPILYTGSRAVLPASIISYLDTVKQGVKTSYIVGGTGVISADQAAGLPGEKERLSGESAYDTNVAVIQAFASQIDFADIYIANGQTMVDALAGVPLAAEKSAPLLLTDDRDIKAADFVNEQQSTEGRIFVLGGESVVSQALVGKVFPTSGQSGQSYPISPYALDAVDRQTLKATFSQAVGIPGSLHWEVRRDGALVENLKGIWNQNKTELTLTSSAELGQGEYTFKISGENVSPEYNTVSCAVLPEGDVTYQVKPVAVLAGFDEFKADSADLYAKPLEILGKDKQERIYEINPRDILSVTSSDSRIVKVAKEKDQWYMAGGNVAAAGNITEKTAVVTVKLKTLNGTKELEQTIRVSPKSPEVQTIKIGYDLIHFSKDLGQIQEQTYFEFATAAEAREGKQLGIYGEDQYGIWKDIVPSADQVVVDDVNLAPVNAFMIYEDRPCSNLTRYLLQLGPVPPESVPQNTDIKVTISYEKAVKEITVKILGPQ